MERKVDTLAVMDRPETLAIQGGVSSHPGLTVQSIKDRNPENKGQSVRKIRRLDCESSDLKAATRLRLQGFRIASDKGGLSDIDLGRQARRIWRGIW
jgi:hypothetical protein